MNDTDLSPNWPVVLAMSAAVLALLVAILALGSSLGRGVASPRVADVTAGTTAAVPSVRLTEFAVTPTTLVVPAATSVDVVNDGAVQHDLAVRGHDVTTPDLGPGESGALDLSSLASGTYDLFCTVPGHAAAGMTATLEITTTDGSGHESTEPGHGDGDASPAAMQAAMLAAMESSITAFPAATAGEGAAVLAPTVLDDGTKLFELVVNEVRWEVEPGRVVDAVAYNGIVPGPTMFVDVGDRVTIRVVNDLDHEGTSLHPHGLKDHEFAIDGVTFISQDPIAPGDAMDYAFVATDESVVTYHSHHMSLHQVPNGLFGAMIIGDYAALAGIDGVVDEQVMVLNDAGNIGFSLNGKSFPATRPYVYSSGDKVVVHYANEGQMAHPMHLHNQVGTVIAKDGYLLPEGARYQGDTFDVAPGERLTVVYEMKMPGTWVWHCHVLSHVKKADGTMFGMLTAVIVEE